jgi:hypothetical protein
LSSAFDLQFLVFFASADSAFIAGTIAYLFAERNDNWLSWRLNISRRIMVVPPC